MSILFDHKVARHRPGHDRKEGQYHTRHARFRHAGRRRRHPRQGRPEPLDLPDLRHRARGQSSRPARPSPVSSCRRMGAADAIMEAAEAGMELVVCITENIPVERHDARRRVPQRASHAAHWPELPRAGDARCRQDWHHAVPDLQEGDVGFISRSGTLTYEVVALLTAGGHRPVVIIGIGGDPIIGTTFIDCLRLFEAIPRRRRRDVRRDRRQRRRGRGGLRGDDDQAGDRLHLRAHRTRRQAHGPRGRDHLRQDRHGTGQGRCAAGGAAYPSPIPSSTSPTW